MKIFNYIYLILFSSLLFVGCSSEDVVVENGSVELYYSISKFDINTPFTRASDAGTTAEQQIDNLYLFLFDAGGANPIKYFIDNAFDVTNGVWEEDNGKIKLKLTQAEAGDRQVYLVANASSVLQANLAGVTNLAGLGTAMESNDAPWSPNLTTPILMSGNTTHNFIANRILSRVPLTRALAKVELSVTLPAKHQDADDSHYRYNFIDFDKNSYVLKQGSKMDDLAISGWQDWQAAGNVSSYTKGSDDKVNTLKLVTYINERDIAGSYIDIQLPFNDGGPLPPPEFGNETFKLPLPDKIERNHWYKFDIDL